MFFYYQRRGKCEWFQGGLDDFVAHYNNECGTAFSLSACLDIVRIGGDTPKQPEVLVTDFNAGTTMAIERKSVVWPPEHIQQQNAEMQFANAIWAATDSLFQDDVYTLTVSGKQMKGMDVPTVRRIGSEIGLEIAQLKASDLPVRRSNPVFWDFRRSSAYEHERRTGIVVSHQDTPSLEDYLDDAAARQGTSAAIIEQISAAAPKFQKYPEARHLVLLDFYGTDLSEDDIPELISGISIPDTIDEIWMTRPHWVSEDEYEIGYKRLFVRDEFVR